MHASRSRVQESAHQHHPINRLPAASTHVPHESRSAHLQEIAALKGSRRSGITLGSHQRASHAAGSLVERMYARRGLEISAHRDDRIDQNRLVITAACEDQVFGTMTLGFDHADGLLAEVRYGHEIAALRARGARICEITRLAIEAQTGSKEVLAALFQLGHIHSRQIRRMTDAVIEVHPRHAAFYSRMLGFSRIGQETICPRVNAPAVLMHIDLARADELIARHAGFREPGERSLYPYFLPADEQPALLAHCG